MIVNFYKMRFRDTMRGGAELLISKNVDCVPQRMTRIMFSGQLFIVNSVYFNLDKCEYDIYIARD